MRGIGRLAFFRGWGGGGFMMVRVSERGGFLRLSLRLETEIQMGRWVTTHVVRLLQRHSALWKNGV